MSGSSDNGLRDDGPRGGRLAGEAEQDSKIRRLAVHNREGTNQTNITIPSNLTISGY